MKKTMLRSLIVGLFAVVSLNTSAVMNNDYMYYYFDKPYSGSLGVFNELGTSESGTWMNPNSFATFEIDAFPYDNYDRTGCMVRVVWGPNFSHSGFYEGDEAGVYGVNDTGADILFQGTHAVYETLVEVDSEGHFWLGINSGPTDGVRYFGTIFYWAQYLEDSFFGGPGVVDWDAIWGWSAWSGPVGWYRH